MWTSTLQPDGPEMTIRRKRIACWIRKARHAHILLSTATVAARTLLSVKLYYVDCLVTNRKERYEQITVKFCDGGLPLHRNYFRHYPCVSYILDQTRLPWCLTRSKSACFLGSRFRVPLRAWMFVSCVYRATCWSLIQMSPTTRAGLYVWSGILNSEAA